jgi:FLVCR family MFS transporter 7
MPFLQGLKSILKNRNFIILLFVFGFYVGTFNVYITLISDYVVANGYSEVITICQAIRT